MIIIGLPALLIALSSLAGLWRESGSRSRRSPRVKRALLALVALAALIPFGIGASSATFVAASSNPNATFSTAADFNTVAVSLTDPGTPLRGTVA